MSRRLEMVVTSMLKGLRSLGNGSLRNPYLHYRQQVANTFDWITHGLYLNSPITSIS